MREIIFRGKRIDNGEWIEGFYGLKGEGDHCIMVNTIPAVDYHECYFTDYRVDPARIGQYIGLKDKNGRRIFEGDIVAIWSDYHNRFVDPSEVMYGFFNCTCCDGVFGWQFDPGDIRRASDYVVIGNIHDNPELLEEDGLDENS